MRPSQLQSGLLQDQLASTITPHVDSDPSGLTGCLAVQEVQQLLKKLQGEEEQLSSAKRSVKELQSQLLAQSQTSCAAQQNATQLKVYCHVCMSVGMCAGVHACVCV